MEFLINNAFQKSKVGCSFTRIISVTNKNYVTLYNIGLKLLIKNENIE